MIYLNYCADTPVSREVLERFCEAAGILGSANARHAAGYAARAVVDAAASDTAALLCVDPTEIIFTSGATESNNLAVKGLALANLRTGRHIVSTPMEHSSVSAPLAALERNGWKVELADVGRDGKIDLNAFERMIRPDTALVAVSAVSSELGAVQPIAEISEIVRRFPGCRLHVDAAQAVGKTELDFRLADTVSFSPHKFYGLTGVGVLYKRYGAELEPQMHGGASTTVYRNSGGGARRVDSPGAEVGDGGASCAAGARRRAERASARGTYALPSPPREQPGGRRSAHPERQRRGREGDADAARARRARRLRVGEERVRIGRASFPRSARGDGGQPEGAFELPHKSQPSHDRRGDRRIPRRVRRMLRSSHEKTTALGER